MSSNTIYQTFTTTDSSNNSKVYKIKSIVIQDDDFDDKLEELMNQQLIYGDINYY